MDQIFAIGPSYAVLPFAIDGWTVSEHVLLIVRMVSTVFALGIHILLTLDLLLDSSRCPERPRAYGHKIRAPALAMAPFLMSTQ